MKTIILSYTPDPINVIFLAARTSRFIGDFNAQVKSKASQEDKEKLIVNLLKWGHNSIFEHVSFTFGIEDLSRVTSHQLVRHRMASFTQQSQRYASMKDNTIIVPPTIQRDEGALAVFIEAYEKAMEAYLKLTQKDIPIEDARYILPHGLNTRIIMTMNLRELIHVCSLRMCIKSQWEIRDLCEAIKEQINIVSPFLASLLKPQCLHTNYCPEDTPCELFISEKSRI